MLSEILTVNVRKMFSDPSLGTLEILLFSLTEIAAVPPEGGAVVLSLSLNLSRELGTAHSAQVLALRSMTRVGQ